MSARRHAPPRPWEGQALAQRHADQDDHSPDRLRPRETFTQHHERAGPRTCRPHDAVIAGGSHQPLAPASRADIEDARPKRSRKPREVRRTLWASSRLIRYWPWRLAGQTWLSLAVSHRLSGRQWTLANLNGRLWTTSPGFEDRRPSVRRRPSTSAQVRFGAMPVHDRPPLSAVIRGLGCHLGCRGSGGSILTF